MKVRFLPLIAITALGCSEDATMPRADEGVQLNAGTVQAAIALLPDRDGLTVTEIRIDSEEFELGAYQGRFTYDPKVLKLVDVATPEDAYRFVNPGTDNEGLVRFAGFTVDEFKDPVAVTLTFRAESQVMPLPT